MEELEKYERVANSETFEELLRCLEDFANKDGMIRGRTRLFSSQSMINQMKLYRKISDCHSNPNCATREYGIRGKMMELTYFNK